ncbi:ribosome-associated translation inhibitor RaiA [Brevundimonas sp. 2R-24]|uniref:Ribosome hibernation promoting factor n=1 Tax=Peiella sedimenti TaxID=3061083 RepID=A0ABT8SHD9_9CAUL|nr:ribosome-associated translation inhibitor RaiA [Caulobacteraceae bacterium XZ-24]
MQVQVSGKHVDVGEALRSRVVDELSSGIGKYFERGGDADVVISREGGLFRADCWVRLASGQVLVSHAVGADAHGAFDGALGKIEKRIRRYKRRLKDHHLGSDGAKADMAMMTVLRSPEEVEDEDFGEAGVPGEAPPQAMVIAETQAQVRTLTVGQAVLELDLSNYPVLLFKNAGHGGLSVVYRRPDGNIGWIDPQRTVSNGNGASGNA